jgi:chemotaxis protein MotB
MPVVRECPPPPPPTYSKDCVLKSDVLNLVESVRLECEQHGVKLTAIEQSLVSLEEDVAKQLAGSLKAVPAEQASVAVVGHKVRVRLSDELLFPSASAQVSPAGRRALEQVAEVLRKTPSRRIEVAGHTDERPVSKGWNDNWQLSSERARQVALHLMSLGIDGRRILVAGYADTDPVEVASTDAARARNRRVDLLVEPVAPDAPTTTTTKAPDDDGPDGLKR